MTNELMPNKQPECFTPNAPIKYATAGGRGGNDRLRNYDSLICHRRNYRTMLGIWLEQPSSAFPSIYRNWIYWLHLGDV